MLHKDLDGIQHTSRNRFPGHSATPKHNVYATEQMRGFSAFPLVLSNVCLLCHAQGAEGAIALGFQGPTGLTAPDASWSGASQVN